MSRLILNIKSAALALAALALAAPSAWGAYTSGMQWKDGVSGNLNAAGNWTGGKAPASGNILGFVNSGAGVSYVTNSAAASYQPRFDKGNFVLVASKTLTANNAFHLASSDGGYTGPASVTKYGDVVAKGYLHLAQVANSHAYFTNMTGRLVANDTTTGAHQNGLRLATGQGAEAEFVIQGGYAVSSNGVTIAHGSDSTGRMIINGGYFFSYGNGNGKKVGTNTVAHASNSTGLIEINGGAYTNENWLFVGNTAGATGTIHVKNGTFNQKCTTANSFVVGGARSTASHGYYIQEGGTATAAAAMIVGFANGADGHVFMKGGTLNLNGQNLHVGPTNGGSGEFVQSGGSVNVNMDFNLGRAGAGTLTVSNGTFTVASGKQIFLCEESTGNALVNLCGGTLVTKYMSKGPGSAVVNFDGGTLKANNTSGNGLIPNTVPVNIGIRGGVIDASGLAITVPAVLASGVSGETDGGMTFKGGGTVTLTGANTYTGVTVIDAGTTIQMPAANNLAGNIVVTNATFADCPITVLTLTGAGADASDILSRCSLAADAPDTVELTVDGASVKVVQKASAPATARLVYDQGTDSWNWEFRDTTDAVIPSVDQSALEASSITVRFGSTDELAAIGTAPAWVGGWQMTAAFDLVSASVATVFPSEFTIEAGTVIDLKGCNWTLPNGLKSATAAFTVTNSVDATKAVLTVDVASGATFTETHLTLGGNIELRKTGEGTYAMTKDQPHTGGTIVTAGAMTSSANRTVAAAANSTGSLTIDGGTFTTAYDFIVGGGENSTGSLIVTNGTFTMAGASRYLKLGSASGATGTVNLNGGELVMNARGFTTGNDGSGEVVFNGGTLTYNGSNERALFQSSLSVKVGVGGGTIAMAAGKYPTNNLSIVSGVAAGETDGGMTFKGGGTFTEKGQLSYTGGTTVEIGTTLVIPDTSLGGGLVASLPATQASSGTTNTLVTTTGEGVFTDSDLPDVTAFPYYRAMLSEDAKSILVVRVAPAMTVTGFNLETDEITLGFEYVDGALDLVVAWDTADHGATLTSWPSGKSVVLGTVAAGTTTATFTLPDEVQEVGMYYRLFLGDSATKPYDEEVAWIQPNGVGACISTSFKPTQQPTFETKINLTDNAIESGCGYGSVFDAGTAYASGVWVFCNASGKIGARRCGFAYSSKTYSGDVTLYGIWSVIKSSAPNATFMVNSDVVYASGFNNTMSGNHSILRFWAGFKGSADSKQFGACAYRFIYSKWWNSGKTTLEAHFIPVKKGSEYGLYDKVGKKLYLNAGAEGTSFKGGADTGNHPPVSFADGQMTASDTQQYLGATVIDQENCSIAMDGATATINWALTQPGGPSADIVAVFTTGSTTVTNVLATGVATASNGVATVENVYATGGIDITLFARSGDNKSVNVAESFPATTVASVPSTPVLSVDETLHQIAATGMVTLGTGTTSVYLDYGATTSYGKRIELTLDEGAWEYTIPYDDALWKAGKVYVRVTAANEIAGIFGTSSQERTATANASFTAGVRTLAQTAFDSASGTATFAFGGEAVAAQDLVVAWGDQDYGENIADWPYNKRAVIGSVAADAITGTYTLPAEARDSGTYYRFFLGDRAVAPYDEEVAWIQPDTSKPLGAYIQTSFRPSQKPQSETKLNLDNQSYGSTWATLYDAGTTWKGGVWVYANQSGRIGARRAGYADFGPFSKTEDLTVGLEPNGSYYAITVNGKQYTHNNYNQDVTITPERDLSFWRFVSNDYGYSKYRLYWSKWWNASKNTLEAHFIPVKKGNEYGLYDIVSGKVSMNSGDEGTAFVGGGKVGYSPVTFATVQTAVTPVRMMGTIELASRDWERPQEHVTLNWTAPGAAATLWVVYSNAPMTSAPGEFADPSEWDGCAKLGDVAADATANAEPYTLCDPLADGNRYKSMRFVLATSGSTEANLVPLVVSEPYRTLKQATTIYIR